MKYWLFIVAALAFVGISIAATSANETSCADYCMAGGSDAMSTTHLLAKPEIKSNFGDTQEDTDKKTKAVQLERYKRYCSQDSAEQPGNLFWCKSTCTDKSGGNESIAKFIDERADACKTLGFLVGK